MRQFDFETNIEMRSPFTGNVFMVDRMTSEYAERHPLNVDAFIMDVAQRHGADVERVRLFFNYGLGKKGEKFSTHCPAKHRDKVKKDPKTGIGDLILGKFPEFVNGCEPALIEAWNKGAEYHTKGFRQGDTLPDRMPSCKITRLDDGGWIALFPKDQHLLDNCYNTAAETTEVEEPEVEAVAPTTTVATTEEEPSAVLTPEPAIEVQAPQTQNRTEETVHPVSQRRRRREQRMTQREAQRLSYEARLEREAQEAEEAAREEERKKIFAAVAAAAVTLIMIHFFGLLGPAVFGLLAGGLLKG